MKIAALKRSIWMLCVVACAALPLWADGPQTGTIDGRVLDAQGQGLTGATVTLTGPQNTRTAITDAEGEYRFGLLMDGRFTVTAELEGLGTAESSTYLGPGQRQGVDLTLRGGTAETITVTAEAELISKYDTASTSSVEAEVAENVGYTTRRYSSTIEQLPGAVRTGSREFFIAVNGGSSTEAAVFIEGVDTSITRRGGETRMYIPTSALSQTKVEGAGFGAEYGRATAGIISSTVKSGTNVFHGDFLYVGQNAAWRAQSEVAPLPRPDRMIDSFETSLGGPIYRDKAWFFLAYAEQSDNRTEQIPDGTVFDASRSSTPIIGKVNLQPSPRHQIAATVIDAPSDLVPLGPFIGDQFTLQEFPIDGTLETVTWSYAVNDSTFLEVKGATRSEAVDVVPLFRRTVDPSAPPDQPSANRLRYIDFATGRIHNFPAGPEGDGGYNIFPRDQLAASVTRFQGNHELKFGGDVQEINFLRLVRNNGAEYRGRGFDENLPSGFVTPINKRVFDPSGEVEAPSDQLAVYAQNRQNLRDRWTLYYGLRLDGQTIDNSQGTQVNDSTEVAPRVSAVYDVNGNGRLLLRGTAGRYYREIPLDIVHREFTPVPNGLNFYNQFGWNPATQRYDIFQRRFQPVFAASISDLQHYYKDEVSAGLDWQFAQNWLFTSRLIWSESKRLFWSSDQFDAAGQIIRDVRNWPDGFRDYQALHLQANRRFSGGWSLQSNLTIGKAEANATFFHDDDDTFEGLGGIEAGTGATNATSVNRAGRASWDRPWIFNVVGMKRFTFGVHDVALGAFLKLQAGLHYGSLARTSVLHPVSGQAILTTSYRTPRDANQLPDITNLNLAGTWRFPIRGAVKGQLGVELANVTDEQEAILINELTGIVSGRPSDYQLPREFRLKVGINF